jgi:hypothetical protein
VEVESTTRSAKERVAGFEDREGHRTPFAPKPEYHHSKELILRGHPNPANEGHLKTGQRKSLGH